MNASHDHPVAKLLRLSGAGDGPGDGARSLEKPAGMAWRDWLILLLQVGAELEHGLMVQYLYAAYSLDLQNVPDQHRRRVIDWRDQILTVAREEMGHLLTVQNVLCLLGGSTSFSRRDFPCDSPFYPFPFELRGFSREVLARFVFAEMPTSLFDLLKEQSRAPETLQQLDALLSHPDTAREGGTGLTRRRAADEFLEVDLPYIGEVVRPLVQTDGKVPVSDVYQHILEILADPEKIPDADFRPDTYDLQASWDDWGRGYKPAPAAPGESRPPSGSRKSSVLIFQMGTRTEAIQALREVMGQGEAPDMRRPGPGEPELSHFARFALILRQYRQQVVESPTPWEPALRVALNPVTAAPGPYLPDQASSITDPVALNWAHLFNLRYRLLLTYLSHTYRLARTSDPAQPNARGAIMHRIFGEMYNLKAISGILVQLPLTRGASPERAGPPFEMPYTVALPLDEVDCWRLYRDMMQTAIGTADSLLADDPGKTPMPPEGRDYLLTLKHLDAENRGWLDQMPGGRTFNPGTPS